MSEFIERFNHVIFFMFMVWIKKILKINMIIMIFIWGDTLKSSLDAILEI